MEKLLRIHRNSSDLDFAKIWNEGIFVFDSNVLLDLYRLPISSRNDLIRILQNEEFNKRIWIGFQVIIEFLNNRLETIGDQKNKFNDVKNLVNKSIEDYSNIFKQLNTELSKLKLKQRHSSIDPDKFITKSNIQKGIKFLNEFIEELDKLEIMQSDVTDKDEIKDIVLNTFKSKIGLGLDKKILQELYKEGEKRYKSNIPPGYKDSKKEGYYTYEDKEYERKYGDLILWKEIIEKAKKEQIKYLVLVTGDVKDDWWLQKRGKRLGPRIELLNEIYTEVPNIDTFYLYDTPTFLKYANNELKLKINEASIKEANDLLEFSIQKRLEEEDDDEYYNLKDTHDMEFCQSCKENDDRLNEISFGSPQELIDERNTKPIDPNQLVFEFAKNTVQPLVKEPIQTIEVGHCDWCNTEHFKCINCDTVNAILEGEFNKRKECEGCYLTYIVHRTMDRKGNEEIQYTIPKDTITCEKCGEEFDKEDMIENLCMTCEEEYSYGEK